MHALYHHQGNSRGLSSGDWLKTIKAEGFSAVIFDCDGTLVHSSDAHMRCMQSAAMEQGLEMPNDWYLARTGLDRQSLFQEFAKQIDDRFDVELARDRSIGLFTQFLDLLRPVEETVSLAKTLRQWDIPLAVVTNAERDVAQLSLEKVGILHLFDPLVSMSDNLAPKPAPDMFGLAATKLGAAPGKILVFEDSLQGVSAALAAGMSVVHLLPTPDTAMRPQTTHCVRQCSE